MKLDGTSFVNSTTCRGVSFGTTDAPVDMAEIIITGRYPEKGWARNQECHEVARVQVGEGQLLLKNGETTALFQGDAIHVPPGVWFAWDGRMTILMACSPAFNSRQYDIEEDI